MQIFVTRKDLQGMCDWLSKDSRLTLLEDMTGWLDIGPFVLTAKKIQHELNVIYHNTFLQIKIADMMYA